MNIRWHNKGQAAFSLMEMMLAASIFVLILIFLVSISDSVSKSWERGEHQVEVSQNGRAILNTLESDLANLQSSRVMQICQNPSIDSLLAPKVLPPNSTSLFFWRSSNDAQSGLAQVGWYVAETPGATDPSERCGLYRFYRPLSQSDAQTQLAPPGAFDLARQIFSLTAPQIDAPIFNDRSSVMFNGTLGFWISCLDRNGNPIPDLGASDTAAQPLRFNSSARFQMASRGTAFEDGATTQYTDSGARTLAADSPPDSIRVILLLTDERTLQRYRTISPVPASTLPADSAAIANYSESLARDHIQTRVFSTVIKLMNSHEN